MEDGWVIILDDDSKLVDNTFIEKLAEICSTSNENDVLICNQKHLDSMSVIVYGLLFPLLDLILEHINDNNIL